jgi:hypothetical protein
MYVMAKRDTHLGGVKARGLPATRNRLRLKACEAGIDLK